MRYRIERDSMGEVNVPEKALWGAQTELICFSGKKRVKDAVAKATVKAAKKTGVTVM